MSAPRRSRSIFALGALLIAAGAGGCPGWREPEPLHAGCDLFTGYAPLAHALRTYKPPPGAAAVRLHKFSSYSDSLRAFRNGRLDLIAMTQYDALLMRARGVPLRAVAVIDHSVGADALVCQLQYGSLRSLRGKRIGLQVDSVSYFLLLQALERQHMQVEEFDLVHLSPHLIDSAFRSRQVEAAVLWEPFVSGLGRSARTLASSRDLEIPIVDLLWVRTDRLEKLRGHLVPLLRHYFSTLADLSARSDTLHAELAAEQRLTPRQVTLALNGLRLFGPLENLETARLAPGAGSPAPAETGLLQAADFMYRKTLLDVPVETDGLFDGSLALEALEEPR